jgi:hypothetical protein
MAWQSLGCSGGRLTSGRADHTAEMVPSLMLHADAAAMLLLPRMQAATGAVSAMSNTVKAATGSASGGVHLDPSPDASPVSDGALDAADQVTHGLAGTVVQM